MTRKRLVLVECGGEGHRSHDGQPPPSQRRSPQKVLQLLYSTPQLVLVQIRHERRAVG